MRLLLMLLSVLELVTFTIGSVHSNGLHLRSLARPHKVLLKHNSPADSVQVAGEYDPDDQIDQSSAQKFTDKGRWLNCLFPMSDADAGKALQDKRTPPSASAQFKGTLEAELETWGWNEYPPHTGMCNWGSPSGGANIKRALDALGLSAFSKADGGDNVCYTVHHVIRGALNDKGQAANPYEQIYTVKEKQYRRTGAVYDFGINHVGGAIFARALVAPLHAASDYWVGFENSPKEYMMPDLRHGSNIMAAYWLRGNPDPKNLKYYIALGIENDETVKALATVMHFKGLNEIPVWPGVTLDARRAQGWMGEMLLGSPIGATLGFILLNYKDVTGLKYVTEIVVFREDDAAGGGNVASDPNDEDWDMEDDDDDDEGEEEPPTVHMVFKIEDVPAEKDKEEKKMPDVPGHGDRVLKLRVKRAIGLGTGVVKREYTVGQGLRVHEFRVG